MKRLFARLIALLLAWMMLLSLTACGMAADQDSLIEADQAASATHPGELAALSAFQTEQSRLAALQDEKAALEAKVADLTAARAEADAVIAALTQEMNDISARMTAAKSNLPSRSAVAKGYSSDITVYAVIDAQGAIAYLTVDASGETVPFDQNLMKPEFLVQFLGKTFPLTLGMDVDAVSGATVSSQAVVDAVNSIIK